MTEIRVSTQKELDEVLARTDITFDSHEIVIVSPAGVWIELWDSRDLVVRASGSSTVTAYGSSTVTASGSSTVRAYDSSTVHAYDSSTVTAGKYIVVHLHSARAKIEGDVPQ